MQKQRVSHNSTIAENIVLAGTSAVMIAALVAAALIVPRREAAAGSVYSRQTGCVANNATPVAASSPRLAQSSRQTAINYRSPSLTEHTLVAAVFSNPKRATLLPGTARRLPFVFRPRLADRLPLHI